MLYNTNLFSQCFYTLGPASTASHVFLGVVSAFGHVAGYRWIEGQRYTAGTGHCRVELCGLYWHFVDIVRVVVFASISLMRTIKRA